MTTRSASREPPGIGRQLVDEDDLRGGAGQLEGEHGVTVAVRARAGDDDAVGAVTSRSR